MPAPTDLNDRIAKAKGWTLYVATGEWAGPSRIWADPDGFPRMHPDFTGTLEGVAGMMQELGDEWSWKWDGINSMWCCYQEYNPMYPTQIFRSPDDRPGDCVGEALLSVLRKETAAKGMKGVCDKGESSVP